MTRIFDRLPPPAAEPIYRTGPFGATNPPQTAPSLPDIPRYSTAVPSALLTAPVGPALDSLAIARPGHAPTESPDALAMDRGRLVSYLAGFGYRCVPDTDIYYSPLDHTIPLKINDDGSVDVWHELSSDEESDDQTIHLASGWRIGPSVLGVGEVLNGMKVEGFIRRSKNCILFDRNAELMGRDPEHMVRLVLVDSLKRVEIEAWGLGVGRYHGLGAIKRIEFFGEPSPEALGIRPMQPFEGDGGFIVVGVNSTETIRGLTSINGISIADLEEKMRRELFCGDHLIGASEGLLDVMAAANDFMMDCGVTHQELARQLKMMIRLGFIVASGCDAEGRGLLKFKYRGRRYVWGWSDALRGLPSPFKDGTYGNMEVFLTNIDNGHSIHINELVTHMVERYGFYEGRDSNYLLDWARALRVFDFLGEQTGNGFGKSEWGKRIYRIVNHLWDRPIILLDADDPDYGNNTGDVMCALLELLPLWRRKGGFGKGINPTRVYLSLIDLERHLAEASGGLEMPVAKDLTAVIDRLERDIDTGALAIPDHAKEFYPEWKQRRLQYLQGVEA